MPVIDPNEHGMIAGGEIMPNGEQRFRFTCAADGTGYIRTEGVGDSGWQNAHYHEGLIETWMIQRGRILFACEKDGRRRVEAYGPGDVLSSEPGVPHNMALYGDAVTHCVKHGVAVGNPQRNGADWYPTSPEFDAWTKSLTIDDITD